ncbi:MAG TPA: FtsX-like permease family protein [Burkholderiales bacterium]|nr:FtsX-like permease family protein [Burkholderiales bacterium]
MKTWLSLAVRNLFRNGRRSFYTVLAMGLGFAAVNALGGFTAYIFSNLKDSYIYAQANGHLTIFKEGFLSEGKLYPTQYLLNEAELDVIRKTLSRHPEAIIVTPQLHISGLLSNGEVSTIFIGAGRVPSDIQEINRRVTGVARKVKLFDGEPLRDDMSFGIGLSQGLANQLKFTLGSDAVAMAPTVSGQINALDAKVLQLFNSPNEALEDKLATVPLEFAQSLYDTTGADRMTVLLSNAANPEQMKETLTRELIEQGLKIEVKTWDELSPFYTKVRNMFQVIFFFAFVIVFTIVVMSVVNTLGMAIMERTREIGTLRALGMKRRGIVGLFALESVILGAFGSLLGVLLTLMAFVGMTLIEPTWIPPQMSRRVPLEIHLVPEYILGSMVLLTVLSVLAANLPARKAARMEIVNALGHT